MNIATNQRCLATLARPVEAGTIALSRFDERLGRSEPVLAEGLRARAHVFGAQALVGLSRGFAPLAPFLSAFRHKTRARICPVYVSGLIGAGDRKSVQPMAARDGEVDYDQLHHFIASGVWDAAPLEKALLAQADRTVAAPARG